MKKYIRYIILFISFLLGIYFLNKWSNKEYEIEQNMLHNNFVLKGKVDSFKISNNHCFTILYISKFKSNSKEFNPKKEKKYFPYAIENNIAEVYDRICESQISIGDSIFINSNNKIVYYKTKKDGNFEGDLEMAGGNISFIKEHSKLFKENFK